MNLYEIMGLEKTATLNEIKKAYRKLSKILHPDKKTGDQKKFIELQNAYDILSDEVTRKKYDETGDVGSSGVPLTAAGRNLLLSVWEQIVELDFQVNKFLKLPEAFLDKLDQMKIDIRQKRKTTEQDVENYKEILKRVIYKGMGADFLKLTMEHKIESSKTMIKQYNRRIEEIECAEKLAKDYGYEAEYKDIKDYEQKMLGDNLMNGFRL